MWYASDIKIGFLCTTFRDCFLFHKLLGMSEVFLIADTSKHVWTMVQVSMMTLSLVTNFSQYQFLLDFSILRYSYFTISSPVFMTCLSTVLLSCNVYGSDKNFTTITYMVLIRMLQYNSPLWWICSINRIIFSILNKCILFFNWYYLIHRYALNQITRLLLFYW